MVQAQTMVIVQHYGREVGMVSVETASLMVEGLSGIDRCEVGADIASGSAFEVGAYVFAPTFFVPASTVEVQK